jgi:hypothetical protein
MNCLAITALSIALSAAPLFAQDPGEAARKTEAERLKELERKVEILSKQLEAQQTGSNQPVANGGMGAFGMGSAASKVYSASSGLSVGGYGEVIYQDYASKLQNGTTQRQDNTVDDLRGVLYLGYRFNDRIVFNSEMEWEHSGYSDEHPNGEAIIEFAYLDFLINKEINVRAGQVLLPIGFTNMIHEPPAVLSVARPFVEREGGIIPTTWHEDGVGLHGDLGANLTYQVYLVNGLTSGSPASVTGFSSQGISSGRQDGNSAVANHLAFSGRLDWNPQPGTTLGGSFYHGNSNQAPDSTPIYTSLFDFHAEYRAQGWQLRGLYARTTNSANGVEALGPTSPAFQVGTRQWGGYLEAGYDVLSRTGSAQALIPFLRWERLNLQQQVAPGVLADPANDQSVLTSGLSWKPIPQVAVKGDFSRVRNGDLTGRNQFDLGIGYEF